MKPFPSDNSRVSACCNGPTKKQTPEDFLENTSPYLNVCTKCDKPCDTAEVPPVGLSRRDEFAKAAMQTVIAIGSDWSKEWCAKQVGVPVEEYSGEKYWARVLAIESIRLADALIKELDRTSPDHA